MPDQIPFSFDVATVSDITNQIKQLLESNFRDVLVEGEISNVNQSRNGHYYFTVKDDNAQLPCVVWRNTAQRLDVELSDGQQVVLGGDIQVYAPHGRYQMIVSLVQQAGVGRLQQKFEELKAKLQKEGLFDDAHKKPLPPFPQHIGVITSSTGAAFHDIRSTFEQRWPLATLYLHHASVQGLNSAGELVAALEAMQKKQGIEVVIIGRGGGSLEDLWPFNEEAVARALFDCPIPTISAVGHEVDFSISDFVADARAATPTQAAIIATPDINEMRMYVDELSRQIEEKSQRKIGDLKNRIEKLVQSHALLKMKDRINSTYEKIENLYQKLQHGQELLFLGKNERLTALTHRLENQNPNAPLEKGFVRVEQDDQWIRAAADFDKQKAFGMIWKDEEIQMEN
jgi:exodeoxyribonuclease VII large subunit